MDGVVKRGALFFEHPQPFFSALAVDAALDIEQRIDNAKVLWLWIRRAMLP